MLSLAVELNMFTQFLLNVKQSGQAGAFWPALVSLYTILKSDYLISSIRDAVQDMSHLERRAPSCIFYSILVSSSCGVVGHKTLRNILDYSSPFCNLLFYSLPFYVYGYISNGDV
jgi:hypothetical protein